MSRSILVYLLVTAFSALLFAEMSPDIVISKKTVAQQEISAEGFNYSPEDFLLYLFQDDFEAYTAGTQLVVQNPVGWTTWTNNPGSGEDPFVSDAQAYSGSNSVVIVQNNDLVKTFGQLTSGAWKISFYMYIPSGKAGYFNTLAGFTPNPFNWAMEVYFDVGGGGRLNAGTSSAATFTYAYDTWQLCEVIVDLDNDMAQFIFDGTVIHTWQWTLGANGGGSPLQLDASDLFGATADDEMYIDDYSITEVEFFDDFESYTAGTQLVAQNSIHWTTWTNNPGSGEDPFVSDAFASSGSNSVVIAQNNDLVKTLGQLTAGVWGMSFQVYIPSGKAGYFNTLAGFTPNPFNWGMEVYFDVGGSGRLFAGSSSAIAFTYSYDTWHECRVIVDLDNDEAQFLFDGTVLHTWQWTAGASGGGSPLQLDANDFFGATADDEMYFDDYRFRADSIRTPVGIGDDKPVIADKYALHQNYPNPFNPTTTIEYELKEASKVVLTIYNVLGQEVHTLVNSQQSAGLQQVTWDGRDDAGLKVPSGIYIYRLQANDFVQSKKMVLLK